MFDQVSLIKKEISEFEKNEAQLSEKLNSYLLELPNLIDNDLPIGTEDQNKLIRTWGTIKKYDFTPKIMLLWVRIFQKLISQVLLNYQVLGLWFFMEKLLN